MSEERPLGPTLYHADPFWLPGGQGTQAIQAHTAVSLKRIADALESIAANLDRVVYPTKAGNGFVQVGESSQ